MIKVINQTDAFPFATSGTITIPATTPGNVLLVLAVCQGNPGLQWVAPNFLSSSDGNFTEVPFYTLQGGVLWDWGSFAGSGTSADILHQVTTGGVTSISFNSNILVECIFIKEVSGLQTPVVVDDFKLTGSSTSVPVVGSALTGSGGNDLCYENFATATQFMNGSQLPWLVDMGLQDANNGPIVQVGVSGTQPAGVPLDFSGNQPSDAYTCVSVAFAGVGSAPTTPVDGSGNPVIIKYAMSDNFNLLIGRFVDTNDNIHSFPYLYSNDYAGYFDTFQAAVQPGGFSGCPWGFTVLPANPNVFYVADQCGKILWSVDVVTGRTIRIAGGGNGSGFPNEIATNWNFGFGLYTVKAGLDGNLYIGDPNYATIICVNMQASPITVCGVSIPVGFAAEVAGFDVNGGMWSSDYSVAVDALGNVYAGEEGDNVGNGNKIWLTDTTGATTLIAGTGSDTNTGDGGPASAASVNSPLGLSIDSNGILYIAANGFNSGSQGQIRAINLSGTTQSVCGKTIAPGNIDTLYAPGGGRNTNFWACAPDGNGNLLVCDIGGSGACPSSKAWMHMIDSAGNYSLIAGSATGVCGFSGDDGPALSALMGVAFGVAIPAGGLFCGGMASQIVGNPLI